uniref:Uncharacterized protein n=1 Tax=Panagrellus redivivus TaxID=6233 RepID=A0A7E4ULN1_PANRE
MSQWKAPKSRFPKRETPRLRSRPCPHQSEPPPLWVSEGQTDQPAPQRCLKIRLAVGTVISDADLKDGSTQM